MRVSEPKQISLAAYTDSLNQLYFRFDILGYTKTVIVPNYRSRFPAHYGIYWCQNFIALNWGVNRSWYWDIPWAQWQLARHTLLSHRGERIASLLGVGVRDYCLMCDAASTVHYAVRSRSGETFNIDAFIEEREYRLGLGWWQWLQRRQFKIDRRLFVNCLRLPRSCSPPYLNIPLDPEESIPHAIWQFCLDRGLEFLPEKYYVD